MMTSRHKTIGFSSRHKSIGVFLSNLILAFQFCWVYNFFSRQITFLFAVQQGKKEDMKHRQESGTGDKMDFSADKQEMAVKVSAKTQTPEKAAESKPSTDNPKKKKKATVQCKNCKLLQKRIERLEKDMKTVKKQLKLKK